MLSDKRPNEEPSGNANAAPPGVIGWLSGHLAKLWRGLPVLFQLIIIFSAIGWIISKVLVLAGVSENTEQNQIGAMLGTLVIYGAFQTGVLSATKALRSQASSHDEALLRLEALTETVERNVERSEKNTEAAEQAKAAQARAEARMEELKGIFEAFRKSTQGLLQEGLTEARSRVLESKAQRTSFLQLGMLFAVVGIIAFYWLVPLEAPKESFGRTTDFLAFLAIVGLKPLGLLVFVQALAWFLLRQHRLLDEDYKFFVKMAVRRENMYSAYLLAKEASESGESPSPLLAGVMASLLKEDLSDRLASNEKSANTEAKALAHRNEIFDFFSDFYRNART